MSHLPYFLEITMSSAMVSPRNGMKSYISFAVFHDNQKRVKTW